MRNQNADSGKRADILRQKRQEKQSEWLQDVNTRAEDAASRPAYKSYEENQRGFNPQNKDKNPLAQIAIDNKEFTSPKIHLSWRFLSALMAIFCCTLLIGAWRSPDYQITDIEVEGINRLTKEEVLSVLDLDQERIFLLSPLTIQQAIEENFPELHNIQVTFSLPADVVVSVEERVPYLIWNYQNSDLWVDEQGYLLSTRGEAAISLTIDANVQPPFYIPEERVILQGEKRLRKTVVAKGEDDYLALFKTYQKIDPVTYQAVKELNQLLPEQGIILYDARRGLGWNDNRGFQVFVGSDLKDIATKMNMVEEIVKTMIVMQVVPTLISIEQINAPYYRLD